MTLDNKLEVLDCTLRDGEQGCWVSFTPESAVKVVELLDGVADIIEASRIAIVDGLEYGLMKLGALPYSKVH